MTKFKIPMYKSTFTKQEAKAVYETVSKGIIGTREKVKEFEKRFSSYIHAKNSIAVNNGTSALHAALLAVGVKDGDEVIVPSYTFISTANVVLYERARPVLVDCDARTFNVTAEIVEKAITKKTKAIVAVDMAGMPVDYKALNEVAQKHSIPLIADSAESVGAKYKEKIVGNQADIHCFSFFLTKNVSIGEGGMLSTQNKEYAEKIDILRTHGQTKRYEHKIIGYNYRMTDINAAIGIIQLGKVEKMLKEKVKVADRYSKELSKVNGIDVPYIPEYVTRHGWYLYGINVEGGSLLGNAEGSFDPVKTGWRKEPKGDREKLQKALAAKGIESEEGFKPVHMQQIYKKLYGLKDGDLPNTYKAFTKVLNLPIRQGLRESEIDYIVKSVKEATKKL